MPLDYRYAGYSNPATIAVSAVPSSDINLESDAGYHGRTKGIISNSGGDVEVLFSDATQDSEKVVITISASTVYPFAIKKIFSANTTATSLFVLY